MGCGGRFPRGVRGRWEGGKEAAAWRVADWLIPAEVARSATAVSWVAAMAGKVVVASRDGLVAVRLCDGGDGGDGDENERGDENEKDDKSHKGDKTEKGHKNTKDHKDDGQKKNKDDKDHQDDQTNTDTTTTVSINLSP